MYTGPLNIAVRAALKAGKFLVQSQERVNRVEIIEKSRHNYVTEIDRHAEEMIIEILKRAYPDDAILAEESVTSEALKQLNHPDLRLWIIDPLDGTTNYLHRFPQVAISIALQQEGRLCCAVIYDPMRDELFTAQRGRGSYLNQKYRIRVSKQVLLENALLGTGFPSRGSEQEVAAYFRTFSKLFPNVAGVRRMGAATLDLAYIASGRLNGFWEFGLAPWDIAAGALLIEEAGGMITDLNGGNRYLETGGVIAGNGEIARAMGSAIAPLL